MGAANSKAVATASEKVFFRIFIFGFSYNPCVYNVPAFALLQARQIGQRTVTECARNESASADILPQFSVRWIGLRIFAFEVWWAVEHVIV